MKHLLTVTETYRVETVDEAEALHEKMRKNNSYSLTSFSYKTKNIKEKGEIIGEYQVVTVKKVFDEEKDPIRTVDIIYQDGYGDSYAEDEN